MKAFVLAAGKGTRLKPWTDSHPKALAEVDGVPMLERVVERLRSHGFEEITVNVHHFADLIVEFIKNKGWKIHISDESDGLLETGGALLKAQEFLCVNTGPVLVHNVDILSNADLENLMKIHAEQDSFATLLASERDSTRKIVIDGEGRLVGWHSTVTDEYRPAGFKMQEGYRELAFSGIYVVSPKLLRKMAEEGRAGRFSIMDYFIDTLSDTRYSVVEQKGLKIIDIGKPDSLCQAQNLFTAE